LVPTYTIQHTEPGILCSFLENNAPVDNLEFGDMTGIWRFRTLPESRGLQKNVHSPNNKIVAIKASISRHQKERTVHPD